MKQNPEILKFRLELTRTGKRAMEYLGQFLSFNQERKFTQGKNNFFNTFPLVKKIRLLDKNLLKPFTDNGYLTLPQSQNQTLAFINLKI